MRLLFYHCRINPSIKSEQVQLTLSRYITQEDNHANRDKTLLYSRVKDQVYTR